VKQSSTKIVTDAQSALYGILFDGMTIIAGGFGACGIADLCIQDIRAQTDADIRTDAIAG